MARGGLGLSHGMRRWITNTARVALLIAAAGSLGGAHCTVRAGCDDDDLFDDDDDDWDDDDDDCDDDDGWSTAAEPGAPDPAVDWTLREYQLLESAEPGRAPAANLLSIRGFSLSRKLGPGVFGDPELTLFAGNVLHHNPQLFALPEGAGQLRFDGIEHQEHFILVHYAQELVHPDDTATRVADASLTFVIDLHGRLIEVQNLTWHELPGAGAPGR